MDNSSKPETDMGLLPGNSRALVGDAHTHGRIVGLAAWFGIAEFAVGLLALIGFLVVILDPV